MQMVEEDHFCLIPGRAVSKTFIKGQGNGSLRGGNWWRGGHSPTPGLALVMTQGMVTLMIVGSVNWQGFNAAAGCDF